MENTVSVFFRLAWSLLWSRALSISSLLVFSYFAGPEPFAAFGLFATIVTILWIIVFGCYEQAILVCADDDLAPIVRLCEIIAALMVLVATSVCLLVFFSSPAFLIAVDGLRMIILFIPFTLAARATHRMISHLATRNGRFDLVAKLNWMQAGVQAATLLLMLLAGWPGVICLVTAELVGLLAVTLHLLRSLPEFRQLLLAETSLGRVLACARKWIVMPTWRLVMSLTSVVALGLPTLVIPLHYPTVVAGQILFAMRMLDVPSNIISGSVSPILQGKLMSPERSSKTVVRDVWLTTALNVAAFCGLAIASLIVAPYFEGTAWTVAVSAFLPLTLYYIGLTTSAPFVGSVVGPRVERASALCQIGFLVANCAVVALIAGGLPLTWVLVAFGLSMLLRAVAFAVLYVRQTPLAASQAGRI